jgi:hypothetical protein
MLESEIDMQLQLLNDQIRRHGDYVQNGEDTTDEAASPHQSLGLFPEVEEPMKELPSLKDGSISAVAANRVHELEQALAYEETVLGESFMESLALCLVVAALAAIPFLDL